MAFSARACLFFALAFTRVGSVLLFTHTHASFLHFFAFSPPRGNFGCFHVLFWRPAGTSGVFMYCFGGLRELPEKEI
jgi:hypothetical protein